MAKKSKELEIKFSMDEASLEKIQTDETIQKMFSGEAVTKKLRSVYFDTQDHALKNARIVLRIRYVGKKRIQTVKSGAGIISGISHPVEDEVEIKRDLPDLRLIANSELKKKLRKLLANSNPVAVFETDIERTIHIIKPNQGCEIEVAFDNGFIKAGGRTEHICEIELELLKGKSKYLADAAEPFLKYKNTQFSKMSKAQRGFALLEQKEKKDKPAPFKPKDFVISETHTASEALNLLLQSILPQIINNIEVILSSENPEGPHQLRIGLRRLRDVLKAYRPVINWREAGPIVQEARKLARIVGELRDADVLIDDIVHPAFMERNVSLSSAPLVVLLRNYRDKVKAHVLNSLQEQRWKIFRLKLAMLVSTESWKPEASELSDDVISSYARSVLSESWQATAELGDNIDHLTYDERHELRKSLKNIRYLSEFFAGAFEADSVKPFLKQLKNAQDVFGYLNDVVVAGQLPSICKKTDKKNRAALVAAGFVLGWHTAESEVAWHDAKEKWAALKKTDKYWA